MRGVNSQSGMGITDQYERGRKLESDKTKLRSCISAASSICMVPAFRGHEEKRHSRTDLSWSVRLCIYCNCFRSSASTTFTAGPSSFPACKLWRIHKMLSSMRWEFHDPHYIENRTPNTLNFVSCSDLHLGKYRTFLRQQLLTSSFCSHEFQACTKNKCYAVDPAALKNIAEQKSLTTTTRTDELNLKLVHGSLYLSGKGVALRYRKGTDHIFPGTLSRLYGNDRVRDNSEQKALDPLAYQEGCARTMSPW